MPRAARRSQFPRIRLANPHSVRSARSSPPDTVQQTAHALAIVALGALVFSHVLRSQAPALSEFAAAVGIAFGVASPAIVVGWITLQTWR